MQLLLNLNLTAIGRQHFDPHTNYKLEKQPIELWLGYITRINLAQVGITLMADLAHKVLRTGSFPQTSPIKIY